MSKSTRETGYGRCVLRLVTNPVGRLLMRSDDETEPPLVLESIPVAPSSAWGVCCSECGRWSERPRPVNDDMNVCIHCRAGVRYEFLALVSDDIELLQQPEAVGNREWWHSSGSDVIDLERPAEMHWGSREAALERAHSRLSPRVYAGRAVFLHRATLRPDSRVHPDVMLERPGEPTDHSYAKSLLQEHDIVRYVNATEAPGSISLLLRPPSLATVTLEGEIASSAAR